MAISDFDGGRELPRPVLQAMLPRSTLGSQTRRATTRSGWSWFAWKTSYLSGAWTSK